MGSKKLIFTIFVVLAILFVSILMSIYYWNTRDDDDLQPYLYDYFVRITAPDDQPFQVVVPFTEFRDPVDGERDVVLQERLEVIRGDAAAVIIDVNGAPMVEVKGTGNVTVFSDAVFDSSGAEYNRLFLTSDNISADVSGLSLYIVTTTEIEHSRLNLHMDALCNPDAPWIKDPMTHKYSEDLFFELKVGGHDYSDFHRMDMYYNSVS